MSVTEIVSRFKLVERPLRMLESVPVDEGEIAKMEELAFSNRDLSNTTSIFGMLSHGFLMKVWRSLFRALQSQLWKQKGQNS